jgi:hypothetical protein
MNLLYLVILRISIEMAGLSVAITLEQKKKNQAESLKILVNTMKKQIQNMTQKAGMNLMIMMRQTGILAILLPTGCLSLNLLYNNSMPTTTQHIPEDLIMKALALTGTEIEEMEEIYSNFQ